MEIFFITVNIIKVFLWALLQVFESILRFEGIPSTIYTFN